MCPEENTKTSNTWKWPQSESSSLLTVQESTEEPNLGRTPPRATFRVSPFCPVSLDHELRAHLLSPAKSAFGWTPFLVLLSLFPIQISSSSYLLSALFLLCPKAIHVEYPLTKMLRNTNASGLFFKFRKFAYAYEMS